MKFAGRNLTLSERGWTPEIAISAFLHLQFSRLHMEQKSFRKQIYLLIDLKKISDFKPTSTQ